MFSKLEVKQSNFLFTIVVYTRSEIRFTHSIKKRSSLIWYVYINLRDGIVYAVDLLEQQ